MRQVIGLFVALTVAVSKLPDCVPAGLALRDQDAGTAS
jgi:hypothetical protein